MNDCGGFWFWFMRPFAETLGAIVMVASVTAILAVIWMLYLLYIKIKTK